MARDTVFAASRPIVVGRGGREMMLASVVKNDKRVAVSVVDPVQHGPERGDAQRQQEQPRTPA